MMFASERKSPVILQFLDGVLYPPIPVGLAYPASIGPITGKLFPLSQRLSSRMALSSFVSNPGREFAGNKGRFYDAHE